MGEGKIPPPLTLDEYQRRSFGTAIYPGQGTIDGLIYTTMGLIGEAGELANKLKKVLRDDGGVLTPETKHKLMMELGDVLWYVSATAKELEYKLETVGAFNIRHLEDRRSRGVTGGSGDAR
jgi:NTP pyrophosphatase (non-canonical NTP hydrolase)